MKRCPRAPSLPFPRGPALIPSLARLPRSRQVHAQAPTRTDGLLLLGAIHYQMRNFDRCVHYNDLAIRIDPQFAEVPAPPLLAPSPPL